MCIKGQKSQIFRSSDRTRWNKDGKEESSRSGRFAGTKKCEGYIEVFGASKLLQIVCQRFCKNRKTSS